MGVAEAMRPDLPRCLLATRFFATLFVASVATWALARFGPLPLEWAAYAFGAALVTGPLLAVSATALKEARRK